MMAMVGVNRGSRVGTERTVCGELRTRLWGSGSVVGGKVDTGGSDEGGDLLTSLGDGGSTLDGTGLVASWTCRAGGSALVLDGWGEEELPERLPTAVRRSWRRMETEPGSRGELFWPWSLSGFEIRDFLLEEGIGEGG